MTKEQIEQEREAWEHRRDVHHPDKAYAASERRGCRLCEEAIEKLIELAKRIKVARERGVVLQAEQLGKHKTASQMIVIIIILIGLAAREEWGFDTVRFNAMFCTAAFWLVLVTVVLTVWSGWSFFWKNRELVLHDA